MLYILAGIISAAIGVLMILKTEWFLNNFGRVAFFEEKLGVEGGSRFGYKLVGIIFLTIGLINLTGSGESFMLWITSPLTRYNPK